MRGSYRHRGNSFTLVWPTVYQFKRLRVEGAEPVGLPTGGLLSPWLDGREVNKYISKRIG